MWPLSLQGFVGESVKRRRLLFARDALRRIAGSFRRVIMMITIIALLLLLLIIIIIMIMILLLLLIIK